MFGSQRTWYYFKVTEEGHQVLERVLGHIMIFLGLRIRWSSGSEGFAKKFTVEVCVIDFFNHWGYAVEDSDIIGAHVDGVDLS